MILAAGAASSRLVNHGLRTFCSITVRSAECMDTHYFAVLVGVGATCVNAYMAQETLADRHAEGPVRRHAARQDRAELQEGDRGGLLKILPRGILVISVLIAAATLEALGLCARPACARLFPGA